MSLFDSLATIIPAVASVAGAALSTSANSSANATSKKAQKKALELEEAKLAEARQIYSDEKTDAQPAVNYLRDVISNPIGGLYPDQIEAQQEERRDALNDMSSSGLRGSGRAVTAGLKKVDSDFVNGALAQNRQNRTNAANNLAGQSFTASNNIASSLANEGQDEANTESGIGTNTANTGTANANLWGSTLGDIGSLIAQETKGRDSRYSGLDVPLRPKTNPDGSDVSPYSRGGVVRSRLHEVRAC